MLELTDVSKKYGQKTILDSINLTINRGEITFIVGTSGAGKTTLLNIIGGLDKPTAGSVSFNGKNIGKELNTFRAKNIGFVFQDFNLISGLSIVENVEIAAEISGLKKDREKIISDIKALGISDPYQNVETLSGGEKQRAAVIRSICKDVDIIIADEPTGNLDSSNAGLVLDMLESLKTEKHIIVVSHDIHKARKYADRIITLCDGNVINDEILRNNNDRVMEQEENNAQISTTQKKPSLFNTIFTLGRNSVRIRKGKILSIAIVVALAIVSLTTVIMLHQSGSAISHNVNVNYLENDLMNLYYNYTPNTGFMELPLSENDILSIEKNYDIKETVQIYLSENSNWLFSSESKTADANIKQININEFFEERTLSNDIEGSFISNKNEIILAEDVAEQLFDENCIGNQITLNDGNGNSIDFTIVGINHTTNPFDKTYSFISAESLKDMLSNIITETIFQRQELYTYYSEVQSMTSGGLYGSMSTINGSEELLFGDTSISPEGVLIS